MIERNVNRHADGIDLYTGALELVQDAVLIVEVTGKVLFLNATAERLTGWRSQEVVGRPVTSVLNLVHADTFKRIDDPVSAILKEGCIPELRGKLLLRSRDGGEFAISDAGSAKRQKGNKTTAVYLIIRQMRNESGTSDDSKAILSSHLESIGALAGGIAHDFNNVLAGVMGNLSLAKMHLDNPEKVKSRLDQAEDCSLRARELSRQLLTFAKGGAPIKFNLQVQESIRASAAQAIHEEAVEMDFDLPADLHSVEVDHGQFHLAIRNLVTHAAHSSREKGQIHVSAVNVLLKPGQVKGLKPGRFIRVSISDDGEGIPPQRLHRIFEPYYITRKTGSGLGLATAFSIISRHEGTIAVESTIGRGTTFHVYLPASTKAPVSARPTREELIRDGVGKVLIMDDEADVRLVASELLQLMGFEIETSPDGGHAVHLWLTAKRIGKPFDLAIFDLTVPNGIGGKEAVTRLREQDPSAKVLVSSGYSYDSAMANYAEHGFAGVVPKPYKAEELARAVKAALKRKAPNELEAY